MGQQMTTDDLQITWRPDLQRSGHQMGKVWKSHCHCLPHKPQPPHRRHYPSLGPKQLYRPRHTYIHAFVINGKAHHNLHCVGINDAEVLPTCTCPLLLPSLHSQGKLSYHTPRQRSGCNSATTTEAVIHMYATSNTKTQPQMLLQWPLDTECYSRFHPHSKINQCSRTINQMKRTFTTAPIHHINIQQLMSSNGTIARSTTTHGARYMLNT
jgi:hypothetical protein